MPKMINYKRIKKECFWDININDKDINDILNTDDLRRKKFLFNKILLNSTNLLVDLKLFKKKELKIMLKEFKVPKFNYNYIFRRKNIVEVYYFDKEFPIIVEEINQKSKHKAINIKR